MTEWICEASCLIPGGSPRTVVKEVFSCGPYGIARAKGGELLWFLSSSSVRPGDAVVTGEDPLPLSGLDLLPVRRASLVPGGGDSLFPGTDGDSAQASREDTIEVIRSRGWGELFADLYDRSPEEYFEINAASEPGIWRGARLQAANWEPPCCGPYSWALC